MSAHTPGPWSVELARGKDGEPCYYAVVAPPTAEHSWNPVASTWGAANGANARLIAAAPDLLAALEEILRLTATRHDDASYKANAVAIAALAKAKGQS